MAVYGCLLSTSLNGDLSVGYFAPNLHKLVWTSVVSTL